VSQSPNVLGAAGGESERVSVLGRVTALLDLGRPREAAAELQRGLAQTPEDHTLWYLLSLVWTELDDHQQALHAAQRAVSFDPQSAQAQRALGLALWNTQVMGRSLWRLRGWGSGNAGRITRPALAALHEALRLDPEDASTRTVLSGLQMQMGQLAQARTQLEAVLQGQPQHQAAQLGMANLALRLKQPAEAEQRAIQVLALDPLSGEALHLRARAQLQLGQPDQAFRTALAAVKLDPASAEAQARFAALIDEYLPRSFIGIWGLAWRELRNGYRRSRLSPEVRAQIDRIQANSGALPPPLLWTHPGLRLLLLGLVVVLSVLYVVLPTQPFLRTLLEVVRLVFFALVIWAWLRRRKHARGRR
jgi:tetratricopeptide (TPR) repeat protein